MLDTYYIETMEQLKIFSDPLRLKIIREIGKEPQTSKMLSVIMELSPSKVNYHLTELERVGLAYIAKTELKNGIQQKFYSPIAKKISLEKIGELINKDSEPEQKNEFSQSVKDIVLRSLSITSEHVAKLDAITDNFMHVGQNIKMSDENLTILIEKMESLVQFIEKHNDPTLQTESVHVNLTYIPKGENPQ